jgi:predicted thioesterase
MKAIYQPGDYLQTSFEVSPSDWAVFHGETVHKVCSTYALAREAEWVCRQFVLQMREDHEEGLGNGLTIDHRSPALTGEVVVMVATLVSVSGTSVNCTWEAKVEDRLVACGTCGQTLWPREKIASHWQSFERKP